VSDSILRDSRKFEEGCALNTGGNKSDIGGKEEKPRECCLSDRGERTWEIIEAYLRGHFV